MRIAYVAGLFLLAAPVTAFSQEIGDAELGHQYAEEVCSPCHAVNAHQIDSPVEQAPPFQIVADTPGMTANALTAWLQTSHPTMPNIILTDEEMRNVIAYILSLKRE
jgi:mono/diheme cytochrome c family protein